MIGTMGIILHSAYNFIDNANLLTESGRLIGELADVSWIWTLSQKPTRNDLRDIVVGL